MPREFDSADMFAPRERGRFGENEEQHRPGRGPRVTGASDIIDVTVWLMMDNPEKKAIAVSDPAKKGKPQWIWLPRSQVEYIKAEGGAILLTLPQWLAKDKGLI
jgi:hypothetical protein